MIRACLLIAFRNLFKNRVSLANIPGLAIGMTAFVLMIQFVRFELSDDDFNNNQDYIYRAQRTRSITRQEES